MELVERRQLVADSDQELELGIEVGLAGADARILDEGKCLRLRVPAYGRGAPGRCPAAPAVPLPYPPVACPQGPDGHQDTACAR